MASDATLWVGAFAQMPEVLRDLGADPADVYAAAGFDRGLFDDPARVVTFRAASHLFRVGMERTGCPHFGLLLGQKGGLHNLGLVGLLAKYSPDVGTALRSLVRYLYLHIRGAVTTFEEIGKSAMLAYEIYAPGAEATDQIGDAALGTMFNVMVALCGPHWKPIEVWFGRRRPSEVAPFCRCSAPASASGGGTMRSARCAN